MPGKVARIQDMAVFGYGFRPFFLLAGFYAALTVPLWLAASTAGLSWDSIWTTAWPRGLWHAHEMVFGFAAASVGGFLLTAIPGWTGATPCAGAQLMRLAALWVAGRVALWMAGVVPPWLVATVDLAFLPALAWVIMGSLTAQKTRRNRIFLALIGLLAVANGLIHLAAHGYVSPALGIELALNILAMMIVIIGGRVIPAFTRSALAADGREDAVRAAPSWDVLAPASVGLVALADVVRSVWPEYTPAAGTVAFVAACINGWRMSSWAPWHTVRKPILWVLHLGYAWLVVGLIAKAAAALSGFDATAAVHVLGVGMIGTMPLAIMTRAGLGHTGRPLVVGRATVVAYGLVSIAAVVRVWAALMGEPMSLLFVAAAAWTAAFAIFSIVYWPILTRPRVDGKPG